MNAHVIKSFFGFPNHHHQHSAAWQYRTRSCSRYVDGMVNTSMRLTSLQLLQEIEAKSAFASQQLGIVRSQIAAKQRESRMLQLSNTEMDALPKATPVYDGVGKM